MNRRRRTSSVETVAQKGNREAEQIVQRRNRNRNDEMFIQIMGELADEELLNVPLVNFEVPVVFDDFPGAEENEMILNVLVDIGNNINMNDSFGSKRKSNNKTKKYRKKTNKSVRKKTKSKRC
jgi:hypothetical protein